LKLTALRVKTFFQDIIFFIRPLRKTDVTERKTDQKQEVSEVKTFPVTFALEEIRENIFFNENTANKSSKEQITEQAFRQGVAAHKEGRLQEAERLYRIVLQSQPLHPDANHNLGVLAVSVNKTIEALPLLKTALVANPKIEQFWISYIDALIKGKQNEVAKKFIEQAKEQGVNEEKLNALQIPKEPNDQELKKLLSFYKNRQFIEAEKLALYLSEMFPKHPLAWTVLAALLKQSGNIAESLIPAQKAVELSPQDPAVHSNLGVTLQELGRLEEAEASCKQAIALMPGFATAHYNLGLTLYELCRYEEAEASYKRAIALKPEHAAVHSNLGVTLQELGRFEEAESSYKKAIALKPNFAEAQSNLANTLKELGRIEESVSYNQKAFANRTGIRPEGEEVLAPATTDIFFELTNRCNFHCTFCPSDSQKRSLGTMDLELVKQLYKENAEKNIAGMVNLHLMGEPTLHPELIEILKFGSSKNVKTHLVTNISTLGPKNVTQILDTLYGTITASHMTPTEETYHFRGKVSVSWDRYISNLRLLVHEYMKRLAKGNVIQNTITIRVMVTQNTASNVSIIRDSNDASIILKEWNDFVAENEQELGMPPFDRKNHNVDDLVRDNNYSSTSYSLQRGIKLTFWRAFTFANTRISDDYDLKAARQTSYCPHPFTDVGVLWNGDVTLCCLDHDGQLKVGNVLDSSIETVINSEEAQKLRASMLGDHPLPSICQTCQERPFKRDKA